MNPALWIAKTGLDAQQTRLSVVSNNLANVGTTGFKRGRAQFEDLLYQTIRQPGGATSQQTDAPTGLMLGTGVRTVATAKEYAQGNVQQTGNSLDVAIDGRGFFKVLMPDGNAAYTRDGSFKTNPQGELVTAQGYTLEPGIVVPDTTRSLTIGADGTVTAQLPGQAQPVQIGTLTLSDFINPAGLQARGENLGPFALGGGEALRVRIRDAVDRRLAELRHREVEQHLCFSGLLLHISRIFQHK